MKKVIVLAGLLMLAACSGNPLSGLVAEAPEADPLDGVETLDDVTVADGAEAAALAATPADDGAPGLFASFLSGFSSPAAPDGTDATPAAAGAPAASGGLFGFGARPAPPTDGPDARIIPFGEQLAYGELATVCDMPSGRIGTRIATIAGFEIYDPIPNSTALRPHYIKGFADGCVRQFHAALTLTGDVGTHELVRYSSANRRQSYSATDNAYEAIKASYCRVGHGEPCGSRLDSLATTTGFLTVYRNFGPNGAWVEILLHDGRVVAMDEEDL